MGLGEKKETVTRFISQGLNSRRALEIAGITRHQYYYRPKKGKPGRKASTHTLKHSGDELLPVPNSDVVDLIVEVKKDPDLDYGYHTTTKHLQSGGFVINHKKVFVLMAAHGLLKVKNGKKNPKTYVKYRKILPRSPYELLEMDIKMIWVERDRRHAFNLNILDTFTRKWLYQGTSFSITRHQVKAAWEHVIINHLQPNDMLGKNLRIEIRNDNDKRFSAQIVQDFFKENHLNQVFTHPYTPQENAHVESFHAILSQHLKRFTFWSITELDENLTVFMEKYNNIRLHSSIAHLCPHDFHVLWEKNLITHIVDEKKRESKFKLNIPRHLIKQHSGYDEPEGSPLHDFEPLDGAKKSKNKEMIGANISNNIRSYESPSVVPCSAKLTSNLPNFESC